MAKLVLYPAAKLGENTDGFTAPAADCNLLSIPPVVTSRIVKHKDTFMEVANSLLVWVNGKGLLWVSIPLFRRLEGLSESSQFLQEHLLSLACHSLESVGIHNKCSPSSCQASEVLQVTHHLF
jgi:hypothetical protein